MGDEDTIAKTARARMVVLQGEIAEPHARPPGPSGRTRAPFPSGPAPIGLLDHLQAAYDEAVTHTRALAPQAPPAPADQREIYRWMNEATRDLEEEKRLVLRALTYRQGLEHAIRAGDDLVVRPATCPECGCFSLVWDADRRRVVCIVTDCRRDGRPTALTLHEVAVHEVEKSPMRAAT